MNKAINALKADLRASETVLGSLHERAASMRDAAPSGPEKAMARRIADRVERAIQQLEAID